MSITKQNRKIALFMGATGDDSLLNFVSSTHKPFTDGATIFDYNLQYHEDWYWLMPVVEKIESIQDIAPPLDEFVALMVTIQQNECIIYGLIDRTYGYDVITICKCSGEAHSKIEATYEAICTFLTKYDFENNKFIDL